MLMACHLLYFIRQSKKSMKNKMIIVCVLLGMGHRTKRISLDSSYLR